MKKKKKEAVVIDKRVLEFVLQREHYAEAKQAIAQGVAAKNLLLLTDHESEEIEQDGRKIKVQPVYEWCIEMGI